MVHEKRNGAGDMHRSIKYSDSVTSAEDQSVRLFVSVIILKRILVILVIVIVILIVSAP